MHIAYIETVEHACDLWCSSSSHLLTTITTQTKKQRQNPKQKQKHVSKHEQNQKQNPPNKKMARVKNNSIATCHHLCRHQQHLSEDHGSASCAWCFECHGSVVALDPGWGVAVGWTVNFQVLEICRKKNGKNPAFTSWYRKYHQFF